MTDRRLSSARTPFRKKVRFGSSQPQFLGYTSNVSENGIRLESRKTFPARSRIVVYIYMSGEGLENCVMEEVVKVEGIVAWVSPTLPGFPSKMGIKFLQSKEEIKQVLKEQAVT